MVQRISNQRTTASTTETTETTETTYTTVICCTTTNNPFALRRCHRSGAGLRRRRMVSDVGLGLRGFVGAGYHSRRSGVPTLVPVAAYIQRPAPAGGHRRARRTRADEHISASRAAARIAYKYFFRGVRAVPY